MYRSDVDVKLHQMNIFSVEDLIDFEAVSRLQLIAMDQFDIGIYVFDINCQMIYHPILDNPIAEDFFFDSSVFSQYLKKSIDNNQKDITVCSVTGIVFALRPIQLWDRVFGYYLFLSNTQGHTNMKMFKDNTEKAMVYHDYYKSLQKFNKSDFDCLLGLFDSVVGTFRKFDQNILHFSNVQNLISKLLLNIVKFKQNFLPEVTTALMDFFDVDNISIALRGVTGEKVIFAQTSKGELVFSKEELVTLYETMGFYTENTHEQLKEHLNTDARYLAVYNFETDHEIIGYFCMASINEPIKVTEDTEKNIFNIIDSYTNAFLTKRNYYKFRSAADAIFGVLDELDIAVSVIDLRTGKLLYNNNKYLLEESTAALMSNSIDGENDYRYMTDGNGEYFNARLNKWFYCNSIAINWINGERAMMEFRIDITENKAKEETIQTLVWKNKLSNLPNRAKLNKDLADILGHTENNGYILLMNIDLFGHINDSYGYEFGDKLILELVRFLHEFDNDTLIYHLAGAEFILICYKPNQVGEVVKKIEQRFKDPWIVETVEQYLTASIGIAAYPKDGRYPEQLIKNANLALKMAKQGGRNKVFYFDSFEDDKFARSLQLEYYLRYTVMKHMEYFKVYYQPIVSAYTGDIVSMEALVRWFDPEIGFVSPGEFIELAESLGLIDRIDNFVLDRACIFNKKIHDMGFNKMRFNVNLSARQLFDDNVVDVIRDTISNTGMDFNFINLEVTETVAINDLGKATEKLNMLRNLGISIALDDFGVGYSSLNSLKNMPISIVKIDKSFVSDMHKSQYNYTFIKTIIELAHSAELKVCCEGVENENEIYELRKMGCDFMQGFFFSKPIPEDEFLKLLTGEA